MNNKKRYTFWVNEDLLKTWPPVRWRASLLHITWYHSHSMPRVWECDTIIMIVRSELVRENGECERTRGRDMKEQVLDRRVKFNFPFFLSFFLCYFLKILVSVFFLTCFERLWSSFQIKGFSKVRINWCIHFNYKSIQNGHFQISHYL